MIDRSAYNLFDFSDKTIVITGGGGILCGTISQELAKLGGNVVVMDNACDCAENIVRKIHNAGGQALAVECDVLDKNSIVNAQTIIQHHFGKTDILINGAGGNKSQATTMPEQLFFDLSADALQWVFNLNLMGTLLPSQIFGREMAENKAGIILNFSSMNAFRPLTRIPGYSAAKAAVSNFTQWLAVHMALEYSPNIRVNAVAPGFFITNQNEKLLLTEDGCLTPRGKTIIDHTPLGRFGRPEDLISTVLWLLSPASEFITGIVVPVDGGFSAFSGV
jgi:NAD(P)-dependent dehydrogenase (short-subunit alcohol dehydrogenase family)